MLKLKLPCGVVLQGSFDTNSNKGRFDTLEIKVCSILTHLGKYTLGNGVEVSGCTIKTYECKIVVFGIEKVIKIFYNSSENLWREVRKEEHGIV